MDNFTHSLIGVALGQMLGHKRGDTRAQVAAAVIASNAPDLDVVIEPLLGGGKLGYLLHHRGYSHTLLALVPLAALSAALGARLAGQGSPVKARALLPAAALGGAFHLIADGWNDYGIHPLSPLLDRWFYGDTLFIVEPLLIFALLPMAILRAESRVVRGLWATFGGLLLVAAFALPQLAWPMAAWVLLWAAGMAFWQHRRPSLGVPLGASLGVVLAFAAGHLLARRAVLASAPASARTLDLVLTPAPANPLCFRVLWVGLDGPTYLVRRGALSLLPSLLDPARCSFGRVGPGTAPLSAVVPPDPRAAPASTPPPGPRWEGEFRAPLAELRALAAEDCRAAAALRFLRVPFWTTTAAGLVIGDMRYDNEPGLGFAELLVPADERGKPAGCPSLVPPWEPPLARPATR